MAVLCANYLQYRVRRGTLRYVPDGTSSGVGEIVVGGTTTPTYGDRSFAMGIFKDPALSTISYENIFACGGVVGNTSRGHSISLPSSDWLWTSTTAASPTTIDLRMTAFGKLYFSYFTASTTATYSYGQLLLTIEFEVRGAVDNATPLGATSTNPSFLKQQGPDISAVGLGNTDIPRAPNDTTTESKEIDSEFVSVSPSDEKKGWYSFQKVPYELTGVKPPSFVAGVHDLSPQMGVSVDMSSLPRRAWKKLPDAVLVEVATGPSRLGGQRQSE